MCNITKKTDKETVTIYKVVIKYKRRYYSVFSGVKIKIGGVTPQTNRDFKRIDNLTNGGWRYNAFSPLYNNIMPGKTSGFATLESAKSLAEDDSRVYSSRIVLKIVLGGEIWEGDALDISHRVPNTAIVYAGSKILSFEEVK